MMPNTQLPTRLISCRVESRREVCYCVLNSQLVHDGFGRKNEHIENLSSRVGCRIGNWVTTVDGWVHTARHNSTRDQFSVFFSSKSVYSRRELFANSTHTADAEATTVESRRRCVSGSTRHTVKRRLSLASVDHGIYIFIFVIIHSKMFRCDWSKSCHVTCSALKFNLVIPWRRNNYVYGFKQYILPSHILPPVTPPIMAQLHPLLLACSCSVVA